jgi:metal-responsive CopG/Arc/MetJ family transcriptional regulator
MKTIAIDESTLKLLDELTEISPGRKSRSALVRAALRQYAESARKRKSDSKDGAVFRKHRKQLARQVRALIAEQARS